MTPFCRQSPSWGHMGTNCQPSFPAVQHPMISLGLTAWSALPLSSKSEKLRSWWEHRCQLGSCAKKTDSLIAFPDKRYPGDIPKSKGNQRDCYDVLLDNWKMRYLDFCHTCQLKTFCWYLFKCVNRIIGHIFVPSAPQTQNRTTRCEWGQFPDSKSTVQKSTNIVTVLLKLRKQELQQLSESIYTIDLCAFVHNWNKHWWNMPIFGR